MIIRLAVTGFLSIAQIACTAAPQVAALARPRGPVPGVDEILARPETRGDFLRQHRVVITARYASEDRPETQITIGLTADGEAHVLMVEALGEPIYEQLQTGAQPRVRKIVFPDSAPFRTLAQRLLEMRIPVEPTRTLFVHADSITIWITTLAGEARFQFSVKPEGHGGGYFGDLTETHPLVQWAAELRRAATSARGY